MPLAPRQPVANQAGSQAPTKDEPPSTRYWCRGDHPSVDLAEPDTDTPAESAMTGKLW